MITINIDGKQIPVTPEQLRVFLLALNLFVDTGDVVTEGVTSEDLAAAKELSGEIRLALA